MVDAARKAEISSPAAHRFEIGTCVTNIGTRLPNGVRRFELVVSKQLASAGEPHYLLQSSGRPAPYTMTEGELMQRQSCL